MRTIRHTLHPIALALASLSLPAAAADFTLGDDVEAKINATVTAGTMIRVQSPSTDVYGALVGPLVGQVAGKLAANADNSDLNFQKNKSVSTVVKGVADLELKRKDFGVFARVMAWDDTELSSGNRAYGNSVNNFTQNAPLSDSGFSQEAKFSNVELADLYLFGKTHLSGDTTLDARLGRQVLNWGVAQSIAGGVNAINPLNLAAQVRPGAQAEEAKIPVGMLSAKLASGKQWGAEGFIQYEFRATAFPGCGTFFSVANYVPTGCNYVSVLPTLNDPTALSTGRYPKRLADINPSGTGQFGLSLRYSSDELKTDFRGYWLNYDSRTPSLRGTNANIAGATPYGPPPSAATGFTRLTDPNGVKYGLIYARGIELFGLSFGTKVDPTLRVFGEMAYRPNQALNLNASDLIAAFLGRSPTSALNLARGTNAIAPGGSYDGYDRFGVSTASLGTNKAFLNTLGADRVTLAAELGGSTVSNLPNPGVLRYGRSDIYGTSAINGFACVDTSVAQKACSHDGFVTRSAWGVRLRASAVYPGVFFGATLTPSLGVAQDVSGYAYDGSFQEGRQTLNLGLRADWSKRYFAEVQYTQYAGGAYNPIVDRDNVTLVVGAKF